MIPIAPPGPTEVERSWPAPMRSGADSVHGPLPPSDQAATRLVSGPEPARSSATTPLPAPVLARVVARVVVRASLSTPMFSRDSDPGSTGPAARQVPPWSAKMPTVPGRLQSPATIGKPVPPNATAVRPIRPQDLPAGVAASALTLDRGVHAVPAAEPSSALPPVVSAIRRPPGPAARAPGAAARPGFTGPAADQLAPSSLVTASGEYVRS